MIADRTALSSSRTLPVTTQQPTERMDFLYLLDQLEEVLTTGTRVPMTNRVMIGEQEVLEILDQIRVALPEEIKAARRVTQEQDRLIEEARREADQILSSADQQVAGLVANHALVQAAEERADQIIEQARRDADQTRQEVDDYAFRLLSRVAGQMERVTESVNRSLAEFEPDQRG